MIVISAKDVSKHYKIYTQPGRRVRELFSLRRKSYHDTSRALEEISFNVIKGECFGIIGDNGSGKSTILQILAGTTMPSTGEVSVQGAISSMLDVTSGFNPDFTGRENVYTKCALLGMSPDQIDALYDSIVEFTELAGRIEHPLKTYSSGMILRIGFSVAIHIPFDVLIVDEVLSVGDYLFQRKCINAIRDFKRQGKTIVITSHSLSEISSFCDRLMLLDKGRVAMLGDTEQVIQTYLEDCETRYARIEAPLVEDKVLTTCCERVGSAAIEQVLFLDQNGRDVRELSTGDPLRIVLRFHVAEPAQNPLIRVQFVRNDGLLVLGTNTYRHGIDYGVMQGAYEVSVDFPEFPLLEGDYFVNLGIWPDEWKSYTAKTPLDCQEFQHILTVHSNRKDGGGLTRSNGKWSLKRLGDDQ